MSIYNDYAFEGLSPIHMCMYVCMYVNVCMCICGGEGGREGEGACRPML